LGRSWTSSDDSCGLSAAPSAAADDADDADAKAAFPFGQLK
jgi:hypothetical protein